MDFQQLLESLRHKSGSLWWLERGKRVGRRYATLYQDVKETRQMLARWGVVAGRASASMRPIRGNGWSMTWP